MLKFVCDSVYFDLSCIILILVLLYLTHCCLQYSVCMCKSNGHCLTVDYIFRLRDVTQCVWLIYRYLRNENGWSVYTRESLAQFVPDFSLTQPLGFVIYILVNVCI